MKVSKPRGETMQPSRSVRKTSASPPVSGPVRRSASPDKLLELALEAPLNDGVPAVTRFLADELATLFPHLALGLCVVDVGICRCIERRTPPEAEVQPAADPARLFPQWPSERIVALDDGGSTLHFAGEQAELNDSSIPLVVRTVAHVVSLSRRPQQTDSDERNSLRAQVIQAEKLASLGQIAAGVVHELNNPLTSIIAYGDFLRKRALVRQTAGLDVEDDIERLDRIAEAAERILRFSRDLVAYARPSSDIPGRVALAQVVDKALVFCEHELESHDILLDRHLDETLPDVRGVSGQLVQVFVNLITNAAHAAAVGGRHVSITTALEGRWVVAALTDDGRGIEEEDLDRIFEPFFTTKPVGTGTGLGLSIVRDIITRHGGALSVESRSGRGTTFLVRLPIAPDVSP